MTPREAARQQWRSLKGQPVSKKLEHIFRYYPRALMGICILILCVASLIWHFATQKETVLSIVSINAGELVTDIDGQAAESLGIDTNKQEIVYTSLVFSDALPSETYQSQTKLFTMIVSGEVDVVIGPVEELLNFAYADYFVDLSSLFSTGSFLYVDGTLLETENTSLWPASDVPEAMEEPIPVLVSLTQDTAAGILLNASHLDLACDYLNYLQQ